MEKQCPNGQKNEMKAAFYSGGIMRLLLLWIEKPDEFQIGNFIGYSDLFLAFLR